MVPAGQTTEYTVVLSQLSKFLVPLLPLGGTEAWALLSGLSEPQWKVVFAASERCQRAKATSLKELQRFYVCCTLEVAPVFIKNVWWRPFVITVRSAQQCEANAL